MSKRLGPTPKPLPERFWPKVQKTGSCWLWLGALHPTAGYGRIRLAGRGAPTVPAHRVAYELLVGPIPDGLVLDHLCRNRGCVNPAHLEPVTNGENVRRGVSFSTANRRKTHCPKGHPYDAANTYLVRGQWRACRTCRREWKSEFRAKARAAS